MIDKETQIALYREMLRIRLSEEKIVELYLAEAQSLRTEQRYQEAQLRLAAVLDWDEAANQLLSVIPDLNRVDILAKLGSKRRFIWLRRNLTPDQHYEVNRLGIPGLGFQTEERRVYPHGPLFAHVVGLTDRDGKGIAGIVQKAAKAGAAATGS